MPASRRSSPPGPRDMPMTVEFQDASWHVDETFSTLAAAGAALCTTELPEDETPPDDPTDRPVPLPAAPAARLRAGRAGQAWADRLEPFLADGIDAFVFFRHDEMGRGPELALALAEALPAYAVGP